MPPPATAQRYVKARRGGRDRVLGGCACAGTFTHSPSCPLQTECAPTHRPLLIKYANEAWDPDSVCHICIYPLSRALGERGGQKKSPPVWNKQHKKDTKQQTTKYRAQTGLFTGPKSSIQVHNKPLFGPRSERQGRGSLSLSVILFSHHQKDENAGWAWVNERNLEWLSKSVIPPRFDNRIHYWTIDGNAYARMWRTFLAAEVIKGFREDLLVLLSNL